MVAKINNVQRVVGYIVIVMLVAVIISFLQPVPNIEILDTYTPALLDEIEIDQIVEVVDRKEEQILAQGVDISSSDAWIKIDGNWYARADVPVKISPEEIYKAFKLNDDTLWGLQIREFSGPENGYVFENLLIELSNEYKVNMLVFLAMCRFESGGGINAHQDSPYNFWGYGHMGGVGNIRLVEQFYEMRHDYEQLKANKDSRFYDSNGKYFEVKKQTEARRKRLIPMVKYTKGDVTLDTGYKVNSYDYLYAAHRKVNNYDIIYGGCLPIFHKTHKELESMSSSELKALVDSQKEERKKTLLNAWKYHISKVYNNYFNGGKFSYEKSYPGVDHSIWLTPPSKEVSHTLYGFAPRYQGSLEYAKSHERVYEGFMANIGVKPPSN